MTTLRVLCEDDVRACVPDFPEAIDLMADGLAALADGRADVRPKQGVSTVPGAFTDAMPAAVPDRNLLGLKWISIFPGNTAQGLPTASGLVVLNDAATGEPRCLMPAAELTAVRTAAVTAACARALAHDGPVTILGAGVQADSHIRALTALGLGPITLWARRPEQAHALRERLEWTCPQAQVVVADDKRTAVSGASTLITALSIGLSDSKIPGDWIGDDALLLPIDYASSIGPDVASSGTFAADDVEQFRVIRDVRRKLGDYPQPELWSGDLIRQARPRGRVIVQNLGSAVNDLLLADRVAQTADASDLGTRLSL